jgi:hypothetical protein
MGFMTDIIFGRGCQTDETVGRRDTIEIPEGENDLNYT